VVSPDQVEEKIAELYKDYTGGLGLGVRKIYYKLSDKYIGIKRNAVLAFLKAQEPYQLTRNISHYINKPIIVKYVNERWSIDLVNMRRYSKYNNGGEFQGLVNDWMRDHGIKFVNTLSYSPQSNGLINDSMEQYGE